MGKPSAKACLRQTTKKAMAMCCRRVVSAAAMWLSVQWLNVAKNAAAFLSEELFQVKTTINISLKVFLLELK